MGVADLASEAAALAGAAVDILREADLLEAERSTRGRTAAYARVRRALAREIGGTIRAVRAGSTSPAAAADRFARAYERAALEAALGSVARARTTPTAATFARVEADAERTARRFAAFMTDVRAGTVDFSGGVEGRADLYLRHLDGLRNAEWAEASSAPGVLWWWELGTSDHCVDCLTLHLESPFQDRPPTVPRAGGTVCGCIADLGVPVTTNRGKIPIFEVRAGDRVLTHRGRWRPVLHVHRRRGRFELVRVGGVVASRDHGWATDAGWLGSPRLPVYSMSHGYLSRMWREGAERREVGEVRGVSGALSLRGGEGHSCRPVLLARDGGEGATAMEGGQDARKDHRWGPGGRDCAPDVICRTHRGIVSPSSARWTAGGTILGRKSKAPRLPLPMGLDLGARPDPNGVCGAPQERGTDGRSDRESRVHPNCGARTASHDWEPARAEISCHGNSRPRTSRERVFDERDRAAAWMLAVDRQVATATEYVGVYAADVMDLSVAEDQSYIVGGQVSHNSNCRCVLTKTGGGREPGAR